MRKGPEELARLRAAGTAADRVAAAIRTMQFSGRAERDLGRDIAELTVQHGHDMATFTIVASGPNSASPHHHTGDRVIQVGDSIVIDFGARIRAISQTPPGVFMLANPAAR